MMPSLHILDQVAIPKGQSAQETLIHTTQLAQLAETLGYERYWFAEHHSTRGLASTAPEILMAHIAAHTSTLCTGSGGILLPQYSPFKVAEVTRQLEALYPGRIEIGVGKSPGGIERTRLALTDGAKKDLSQFDRQLKDLLFYLSDSLPSGHPHAGVKAAPLVDAHPPVWLLGLGKIVPCRRRSLESTIFLATLFILHAANKHLRRIDHTFLHLSFLGSHNLCLPSLSSAVKQMKKQTESPAVQIYGCCVLKKDWTAAFLL